MVDNDYKQMTELEDDIDRLTYEILQLKKKMGLLTEEEEQMLKQLETKFKMNEMSIIGKQEDELEKEENPFSEQENLNEQHRLKAVSENEQEGEGEDSIDNSEVMHSRITDEENFAELPPMVVMTTNTQKSLKDEKESLKNKSVKDSQKDIVN